MSGFSLLPTKQVDVFILMTEERAGFSPNHLKSVKVGYGLLMGFRKRCWYAPASGTSAGVVRKADPRSLQPSEPPALSGKR